MSNWIYSKDGKEHGPMSTARVADDVLKGLLELDDYVLSVETQLWKKVREVQPIMDIVYKPMPNNLFEDVSRDQFSRFVQGEEDIFAEPIFFNMPWTCFIILQVLTVGTFQVYWFIRQWMYMTKSKSRGSFRIILFLFVAAFYIFSEIEHDRDLNKAYRPNWTAMKMAFVWYLVIPLLAFGGRTNNPVLDVLLSLPVVIFSTSLVLIPIQKYINECNEKLRRPLSKLGLGFYFTILITIITAIVLVKQLVY